MGNPALTRRSYRLRGWREWPLARLPTPLRYYIIAVPAAAVWVAAIMTPLTSFQGRQLAECAILLGCGLASVEATRRIDYTQGGLVRDLLTVWCLPVAILLPPFYALLVPFPLLALTQLHVHRGVVHRRVFSAASIGLAYTCASWAFRSIPGAIAGPVPTFGRHAVTWGIAVAACDLLAWLINNSLILIAIKGSDPTARARDLVYNREAIFADFVQWNLAVIVTVVAAVSPWLLSFAAVAVCLQRRFMMHAQLVSRARMDAKTGLLNAAAWEREATAEIARAVRARTPLAVGLIDIDHFKAVNDTYGHLTGDEVLRAIGRTLTETLRPYDLVGRFGGEEFAFLLPHTSSGDAAVIAERLRGRIGELPVPASPDSPSAFVRVTVSAGVVTLTASRRELTDLLAAADASLYAAKQQGRNRICVVTDTAATPRGVPSAVPYEGGHL